VRASSRAHLLSASVILVNLPDRLRRMLAREDLMKKLPLFVAYVIPSLLIRIPSLFQNATKYVWIAKTWTSLWQPEESGTKLRF